MTTAAPESHYVCAYCRIESSGTDPTCPHCGARIDVRRRVSDSGWVEQPPIRDMSRIRFSRSTCQISGTYVPSAEISLHEDDSVYFSHHQLLHMDPSVRLEAMQMGSAWNRSLAGMPLVMCEAHGPGHLAISADAPGETLAVPLTPGRGIDVVEHRFLAATSNVGYTWEPSGLWYRTGSGDETETHYPLGYSLDHFSAKDQPGLLLLHSPGNTFTRDLGAGEEVLIQPSSLVWKDRSVQSNLHVEYPAGSYWFSSATMQCKTVWLLLTGPGRIAIQSVFERPEAVGYITGGSYYTSHHW